MPQPYPDPTNLTGIVPVATYVNAVTGNWFWSLACVTAFIIIFFGLLLVRSKVGIALLNAGWITTILAALLWVIGLVEPNVMLIMIFIAVAGGLISYFED